MTAPKKKRPKPTIEALRLRDIRVDGGTQTRVAIDQPTVDAYAEAIEAGRDLPPPEVYGPDEEGMYWVADGFHRVLGHSTVSAIGTDHLLPCAVRPGGFREALAHSLSANETHGLRRSIRDKENAVRMALAEWSEMSTRTLADLCDVSAGFAERVRRAYVPPRPSQTRATADTWEDTVDAGPGADPATGRESLKTEPATRTGADGKNYPADPAAVKRAKAEKKAEDALPDNMECHAHLWDEEAEEATNGAFSGYVGWHDRPEPEEILAEVDYRGVPTWGELLKGRGVIPVTLAHRAGGFAPWVLVSRRLAIDAIQTMDPPLKIFRAKPISPRQAEKLGAQRLREKEERGLKRWLAELREAAEYSAEPDVAGERVGPDMEIVLKRVTTLVIAQAHPLAAEWTEEIYRNEESYGIVEATGQETPAERLIDYCEVLSPMELLGMQVAIAVAYDLRTNGRDGVLATAAEEMFGQWIPTACADKDTEGEGGTEA